MTHHPMVSKQSKRSRAGDRSGFAIKRTDKSGPKSRQPILGNVADHRLSYNTDQAKSMVPQPRARLMDAVRDGPSAITSALQYPAL